MGGTALRIVYGNQRFSEDLDFDNINLKKEDFENLIKIIENFLKNEGYQVEIRTTYKKAFHCYFKIPAVLYEEGLSNLPNQKITIRVDTTPQNYKYTPSTHILDSFDVFQNIKVAPLELLMSQKIVASLKRKRPKGRDFFDISFMISKNIKPDMQYFKKKLDINNGSELIKRLSAHTSELDLDSLAKNVEPFLFNPSQISRITNFKEQLDKLSKLCK
jgi:predicted nucleotidyltransferase component of viral defense system